MALKTISIPIEEYNVLRGTFKKAIEIIDSLGMTGGLTSEGKPSRQNRKEPNCKRLMTIKN